MDIINNFFADLSNFLWGNFGVANLVIGGGIFFLIYSRLTPFRYFKHAFEILLGKHDNPDDDGQFSHFQALSTALSSTVADFPSIFAEIPIIADRVTIPIPPIPVTYIE